MQKTDSEKQTELNRVLGKQNYSLGNVVRASYTLRKGTESQACTMKKVKAFLIQFL